MDTDRFSVSASGVVEKQILAALEAADRAGRNPLTRRAAAWILEELARTPLEFGESRQELQALNLKVRVACVEPFMVQFAVHEEARSVFILQFVHYGRPKPSNIPPT